MEIFKNLFATLFAAIFSFTIATHDSLAADQNLKDSTIIEMLSAVQADNYDAFMAKKSEEFRKAIPKDNFQNISASLSARLKTQHELIYFGSFKREGHEIFLWKISYKDNGNDNLIMIAFRNRDVSGFWFR